MEMSNDKTITETLPRYIDLNVHERINAKANGKFLWSDTTRMIYRKRANLLWDMRMYRPSELILGKHREYDYEPSEPDYDAVTIQEQCEMAYKEFKQ